MTNNPLLSRQILTHLECYVAVLFGHRFAAIQRRKSEDFAGRVWGKKLLERIRSDHYTTALSGGIIIVGNCLRLWWSGTAILTL